MRIVGRLLRERQLAVWVRYVFWTYAFLVFANLLLRQAPFSLRTTLDGALLGTLVYALAEVLARNHGEHS